MADFTPTQGRYLAFINAYIGRYGIPPAESDIGAAMCVSAPSVNQMVKMLEKKGLVLRNPGQPRSLQILVPEAEIPPWNQRKSANSPVPAGSRSTHVAAPTPKAAPVNLYRFSVFLMGGPVDEKFANKVIRRDIEIRGDQTLEQFHEAIFGAFDRDEEHLYEFQFGKRSNDPAGPNFGNSDEPSGKNSGDARKTIVDDLALKKGRVFGYRFDFGAEWFHIVQVEKLDRAIPTVTYPRVIKRVGQSPPQHRDD